MRKLLVLAILLLFASPAMAAGTASLDNPRRSIGVYEPVYGDYVQADRLVLRPESTAHVQSTTWGAIKALYRGDPTIQ